MQEVD